MSVFRASDAPNESAPIESAPIEGAPTEGAPNDSAPHENDPHYSAPIDGAPHESASHYRVPSQGVPHESAQNEGALHDGAPSGSAQNEGTPHDSAPSQNAPDDSAENGRPLDESARHAAAEHHNPAHERAADAAAANDQNPNDQNPNDQNPNGENPNGENRDDEAPGEDVDHAVWSGPERRAPYPEAASFPESDDPTVRIMVPAHDAPAGIWHGQNRLAVLAVIIAVIALAVACGAIVTAWTAIATAGSPTSTVHPSPTARAAAATATAGTTPTAGTATATLGPLPEGFAIKYAQDPLQVPAGCGTVTVVDLDTPRVDPPDSDADLRFSTMCGTGDPRLLVQLAGRAGSVVADPDTDVPGCVDAIRANPLDLSESVPVQTGTTICVLTSETATPVLALVEITGVDAAGGASLRASAWSAAP
jgi:hypothetical protein